MNRWIKVLAASVLTLSVAAPVLVVTAAPAVAQAAKPAKGKKKGAGGFKRLEAALEKLNLNAEQKPKVDAAIKDAKAEAKKIADAGGTPEEARPKMRAVQKTLREKLTAILTPEQQKQFKEATARKKDGAAPKTKKPATS
jgi:Spy/CpxP family protein refolding chaperone